MGFRKVNFINTLHKEIAVKVFKEFFYKIVNI